MHFSSLAERFPGSRNRLYEVRDKFVEEGRPIVDLISGNVNEHGIVFPDGLLKHILAEAAEKARVYKPDSFGQLAARGAIAGHDPSWITADRILLTPGTSVTYWYCFKLLCETGDEVLCPTPSYPLFDYIAKTCGVHVSNYRLSERHGWTIDLDYLEEQITERTRAIVVISPHNPTGKVIDASQADDLAAIARRQELPIIADEVFSEFVFEGQSARVADGDTPLVFTLNGFSKMFALPGMKIGWVAVSGESSLVGKALATLELISDTFLPVNEIAQFAVPAVFEKGDEFLEEYRSRMSERRNTALAALEGLDLVAPQGGFYLILPYTRDIDDEDFAIELLEEENLLVHPGYFYDIEGRHLVLSYVQEPAVLDEALQRLRARL